MPESSNFSLIICITTAKKMLKRRQAAGQPCFNPAVIENISESLFPNLILQLFVPYKALMSASIFGGIPMADNIFHRVGR